MLRLRLQTDLSLLYLPQTQTDPAAAPQTRMSYPNFPQTHLISLLPCLRASQSNDRPIRRSGISHRCTGAFSYAGSAGHGLQDLRQGLCCRGSASGCCCILLPLLADLTEILNIFPAAHQNEIHHTEPVLCGIRHERPVYIINQTEHDLYSRIRQWLVAVLDFPEFCIGQHDLKNAFKDVIAAVLFCLIQLGHGRELLIVQFPQCAQTHTKGAGEICQHTVFNIAVLQNITDVMRNVNDHLRIFRAFLDIVPQGRFIPDICGFISFGASGNQ